MLARKTGFAALAVAIVAAMVFAAYVLSLGGPIAWLASVSSLLVAGLVIAVLCVLLPPGRRQLHAFPERGGVGLSNSRAVTTILLLFATAFYLFVIGFVLIWIGSGSRPMDAGGPVVFLVLAVLAGVPAIVTFARGRYRLGGLLITPEKIVYRSYRQEHCLAWSHVLAVEPAAQPGALRVVGRDARDLSIPCGLLRASPTALTGFLEFYRATPRARGELGDHRALERFAMLGR